MRLKSGYIMDNRCAYGTFDLDIPLSWDMCMMQLFLDLGFDPNVVSRGNTCSKTRNLTTKWSRYFGRSRRPADMCACDWGRGHISKGVHGHAMTSIRGGQIPTDLECSWRNTGIISCEVVWIFHRFFVCFCHQLHGNMQWPPLDQLTGPRAGWS